MIAGSLDPQVGGRPETGATAADGPATGATIGVPGAVAPVSLTLDGRPVEVPAGTTILAAARQLGIDIPTLCYHPYCTANALCRVCVVEVEGARTLIPACVAEVGQGMVVRTDTERVVRARRVILELLSSAVDLSDAPEVIDLLRRHGCDPDPYPGARRRVHPVLDDNPMYVRDYSKCILCWRCVQVCAEDAQYTFALTLAERGFDTRVATYYDKPMPETTCVFCGQCVAVCPTGALKARREWMLEREREPVSPSGGAPQEPGR